MEMDMEGGNESVIEYDFYGNGSQNDTENDCGAVGPGGLLSESYFQGAVYSLYLVIFVTALVGNGLVCYVVKASPRMRTVTNYFIGNLAIGDILMALFCVPFSSVHVLLQHWPFGPYMCRLVSYTQAVSVFVSNQLKLTIAFSTSIALYQRKISNRFRTRPTI